jgi:hypothetical protein
LVFQPSGATIRKSEWSSACAPAGPPNRGARYAAGQTGGGTLKRDDAAEGLRESIHRLRSRYSIITPYQRASRARS